MGSEIREHSITISKSRYPTSYFTVIMVIFYQDCTTILTTYTLNICALDFIQ